MAVTLHRLISSVLPEEELLGWDGIPTAIVSDELNREAGMGAHIVPISAESRFVGEALTVSVMVGDNLALHVVANSAFRGAVIVVDAGSYARTAVWGEVLHAAAQFRGVVAVVIDGAIRDRAVLRHSTIPVFACGSAPNGPHKGWGGTINGTIQCGGVSVSAGDLVIGDDDGVVVVPKRGIKGLRERCRRRMQKESEVLEKVMVGASTIELLNIDAVVIPEYEPSYPDSGPAD